MVQTLVVAKGLLVGDEVMVAAPAAGDSRHPGLGWHDLACTSSLTCSQRADLANELGAHSTAVAIESAPMAYDQ